MKFCYPAVFKEKEDGSFSVRFPDLSGCEASGACYEEALQDAKEALLSWLSVELLEDMNQPPFVSELSDLPVGENEKVQLIAANIRFMEGWDE